MFDYVFDTAGYGNGPKITWNKDLMPLPLRPFRGIRGARRDQFNNTKRRKKTEGGSEPLPLSDYGFGFEIVRKYGWDPDAARGLGKLGHGIATPINIQVKNDRVGLMTEGEVTADGTKAPNGVPKKRKPLGAKASEKRRLARRKLEQELGLEQGALAPANTPPKDGGPPGRKKQRRAVSRRLKKEERLGLPTGALKGAGMLPPKLLKKLLRGDASVWEGDSYDSGGRPSRREDEVPFSYDNGDPMRSRDWSNGNSDQNFNRDQSTRGRYR